MNEFWQTIWLFKSIPNFDFHTNENVAAKAHQRASLILRCFECRDRNVLFRALLMSDQFWSIVHLFGLPYIRPILNG